MIESEESYFHPRFENFQLTPTAELGNAFWLPRAHVRPTLIAPLLSRHTSHSPSTHPLLTMLRSQRSGRLSLRQLLGSTQAALKSRRLDAITLACHTKYCSNDLKQSAIF